MLVDGIRKSDPRYAIAFCVLSTWFCVSDAAVSIATTVPAKTQTNSAPIASSKAEARPLWSELTETQRLALAPLESEWSKIDTFRKKKWLQISSRFTSMKPDEQQRLQEKMRVWAKLSPDERRHAREVYSRTKSLDAEQKSAQWQQYQQLPDTEKMRLSKDITAKKHVANLPTTAAAPLIKPPKVLEAPAAKTGSAIANPGSAVGVTETGSAAPGPAAAPGK